MGDLQVLIVSLEFLLLPVDAAGTSALRSAIMGSAWRRVVFDECHEVIKLADVHRPRPGGRACVTSGGRHACGRASRGQSKAAAV